MRMRGGGRWGGMGGEGAVKLSTQFKQTALSALPLPDEVRGRGKVCVRGGWGVEAGV